MEKRTFFSPDVACESEIEFCRASWIRNRKYVSWRHWFATKSLSNKPNKKEQRTARYKLFEMGHYAGAVILEIGMRNPSHSSLAVRAAKDAFGPVQYYGVETDESALILQQAKFKRKRIHEDSVFFKGTLAEFRNFLPVTPTMVIINQRENVEGILSHLALFLAAGTPVLVQDWYQNRADLRPLPQSNSYERLGRFGESVLLKCTRAGAEHAAGLGDEEFQLTRQRFGVGEDGRLIQNRGFYTASQGVKKRSDKKWPFKKDPTRYPSTLPDGSAWPKISIVTPSYNQGRYIEETIASVLSQNYPHLEYIIVDGQSTDETHQVFDKYKDDVDYLICEPDEGQSDAINKGMAFATGEILTWLNSDDMLSAGALYSIAMAFWKSQADMVVGAVQFVEHDEITSEHLASCPSGPLELTELLDLDENWLQGRFFYQPEVMFTRDLWQRAGGYVDKELYYSMDYDMWVRFAIAGANVHVIGRPIAMYRVHDEQKTFGDYEPELRRINRRHQEKHGFPTGKPTTPSRKYRVTYLNDVGVRYGAGIAHGRLRDSVVAAGHETQFVFAKPTDDSEPKSEHQLLAEVEATEPDLVMIGNLHNAGLGMGLVDQVSSRWSSCFVMHDLWMATGRCLYPGDCGKFRSSCDANCPTASEYPAMNPERIQSEFQSKLNIVSGPPQLVIAANSQWTKQVAEQSSITSKGLLTTLKYGFPTDTFRPRDKSLCREILGLPDDAFIVLFASVNVTEQRKGLRHLFEALNRLQLDNLVPVCIGHALDSTDMYPGTISLGYVDDPNRTALIYSAADVFVGPSLEEAFGQVFVEAAACGTPSIGYPVGGVQEAIQHGVTGRIVEGVSPAELADEIALLYYDSEYRENLAAWGRILVENEWSLRSAYHHFNNVLRQMADQIGFLPPAKIEFDPAKTMGYRRGRSRELGLLEKTETRLVTGTGLAAEERLQLTDGTICQARWAVGNQCHLNICVDESKPQSVWVECLNPVPDQRITVFCNDTMVSQIDLEAKRDFLDPESVCLVSDLLAGEYQIRIEFSGTVKEQAGVRELAMLFANIRLEEASCTQPKQTRALAA